MRQVVYAVLPLGEGIVVDPFMGSGSTIAAAEAIGISAVGVERVEEFYTMSRKSISQLAQLDVKIQSLAEYNQPSLF